MRSSIEQEVMTDTIFGKITRGEIPTEFLYEDEHCVVIRDINPQAPTHVLIIPRKPIPMLVEANSEDQALLGHLLLVVGKVAEQLGVGDAFRLVINNGAGGGQTVFHLHLHILAGREMVEGALAAGLH
jgi:histidine triad (HIT) family protein